MEGIDRKPLALFFISIFFLLVLSYGDTLHHPFNFDDSLILKTEITPTGDKYFQSPLQYRHLFYLSFALNYDLGKTDPQGYHVLNISFHFLTTLLVFFISWSTFSRGLDYNPKKAAAIAGITTLFFAISPVHTETVTYISGRATGLAGFFFLLALLFFILANFREKTLTSRVILFLLSALFFFAAVLSKETSLTLPAIMLLYDYCFMNGEKWFPRKNRLLYFYLPAGSVGALALFQTGFMKSLILEWAQKMDFNYALQQTRIIGHAIHLLLFPIGLTLDYDFPDSFFPHPVLTAWPLLLIAVLLWGTSKYFPNSKRIIIFGVAWFLLTLAPTNSFLPRLDLLSERNLYLPSFGLFFIGAFALGHSFLFSGKTILKKTGTACLIAILSFQAFLLIERNGDYRSNIILWEDTVKKAPGKTRAWQNLSHYYLIELNYEKTLEAIQGLMRSNPSDKYLSQAHSKLGVIHSRQGQHASAIASYEKAIQLDPSTPVNHLNLGGLYIKQGKFKEAKTAYDNAERLFKNQVPPSPLPPTVYLNKAFILFNLGSFHPAKSAIETYLIHNPESQYTQTLLGNINLALR
ncbi:MAG: tetratricopeptide repeat protein [Nitrospinota bacterium]